jgi:hypothetical protein
MSANVASLTAIAAELFNPEIEPGNRTVKDPGLYPNREQTSPEFPNDHVGE